jgi:quercetin dioxygenase-like cupin family protein
MKSLRSTIGLVAIAMAAVGHTATPQQPADQPADAPWIFPRGEGVDKSHFSAGQAWVHWILRPEGTYNTQLASVTYEQGSRTRWHYHPAGQILIIVSGTAYYQEKGGLFQKA